MLALISTPDKWLLTSDYSRILEADEPVFVDSREDAEAWLRHHCCGNEEGIKLPVEGYIADIKSGGLLVCSWRRFPRADVDNLDGSPEKLQKLEDLLRRLQAAGVTEVTASLRPAATYGIKQTFRLGDWQAKYHSYEWLFRYCPDSKCRYPDIRQRSRESDARMARMARAMSRQTTPPGLPAALRQICCWNDWTPEQQVLLRAGLVRRINERRASVHEMLMLNELHIVRLPLDQLLKQAADNKQRWSWVGWLASRLDHGYYPYASVVNAARGWIQQTLRVPPDAVFRYAVRRGWAAQETERAE